MEKRRLMSFLLVVVMLISVVPVTVFAAEYTDTQGHWGEKAIDRWTGYNIVSGKGGGIFDPDGFMIRAEAAQVFANLFKLQTKADLSDYTDVGLGKWYDDAIAKCISSGIMEGYGDGIIDPNGTITREMFFVMFSRALGIKPEDTVEKNISDASIISNYAKGYITTLVNKGYIKGTVSSEDGIIVEPKIFIDRASVMSLLNQTITTYVDTTENVAVGDGLTLVVADNAKLSFKNNAENAEVFILGNNVTITNAPVGTVVTTSDDATGTKVNGKSVSKDTTIVVEKTVSSDDGSYTPPTPPVPPVPTTYTVTFDMQGYGTQVATYTDITSGSKISAPTAPTEDGYDFKGWSKVASDTNLENLWDFENDTITDDVILYAQWAAITYTVTFDMQGHGTQIATYTDITFRSKIEAPTDPTATGYTFGGWYKEDGCTNEWTFDTDLVTANTTLYAKWVESACVAAGTMITMENGGQKAIEDLEIGDVIRTFDHETGQVSSAPVCFIWETRNAANAFTLSFENDIKITVIEEHGFYDFEEMQYVFINAQNANDYLGHHFYDADNACWRELKSVEILNDCIDAYAIITSNHLNHLSNGILSMCDGTIKMLANIFEYDAQMKFDADQKKADIEAYGLTSLEKILELKGFTESDYYDYNLQYIDVMIGKGLSTWESMEALGEYCVANGL